MKLNFKQNEELNYEAEFKVESDFNLHVERVSKGPIHLMQRGTSKGEYSNSAVLDNNDDTLDYDFAALVYPKWIKVVSGSEVVSASVNFNEGGGSGNGGGETSKPRWTGNVDVEGLKAIGWTDEDIAYYQANGVNWNEEDDDYHKVSEDNIALYGVLTANNIFSYRDRIVYLPKIDTKNVTDMGAKFLNCYSLVAIPQLDTSSVTYMGSMFQNCYSLVCIPQLDTQNVTNMKNMFLSCGSLVSIPQLDTSKVTDMGSMFGDCKALVSIPQLNTSSVTSMNYMFQYCYSLVAIPQLDVQNITNMDSMLQNCFSLVTANLKNVKLAYQLNSASKLNKESLLYIINNEASTSAITIKLASYAYTRLAEDADVVAALANHPNISLAV